MPNGDHSPNDHGWPANDHDRPAVDRHAALCRCVHAATIPNDMTLFFQLLFASGGLSEPSELGTPNVGMASFAVTGVYRTAGGGGGIVKGSLNGDIDNGQFTGTVVFEAPGCTAEREYSGTITSALP